MSPVTSRRERRAIHPGGKVELSRVCSMTITTRSMQGMFGASVSELYLLIRLLINTERTVDLCMITKEEIHMRTQEL